MKFDVQLFSLETGEYVTYCRCDGFFAALETANDLRADGTKVRVVEVTGKDEQA